MTVMTIGFNRKGGITNLQDSLPKGSSPRERMDQKATEGGGLAMETGGLSHAQVNTAQVTRTTPEIFTKTPTSQSP